MMIMIINYFDMLENSLGKGVNAGYQHVLFLPTMFTIAFQ